MILLLLQISSYDMRLVVLVLLTHRAEHSLGNPDAKRLYDEILSGYNKLVRPVKNVTDPVTVKFKLKLSQLIDVNLRNQARDMRVTIFS